MKELTEKIITLIKDTEISVSCTITGELLVESKVSDVRGMVGAKLTSDLAKVIHDKYADATINEFEHPYLEGAKTFTQHLYVLTMDNILDIKSILET